MTEPAPSSQPSGLFWAFFVPFVATLGVGLGLGAVGFGIYWELDSAPAPTTGSVPTTQASGPRIVVGAAVIPVQGSPRQGEGNIQLTYSDGRKEIVAQDGRAEQAKVSPQGAVGWVYAIGDDPKYGCVKEMLVVRAPDGSIKNFESNAIFIEDWAFADNDTTVVMQSMEHHGPYTYRKYDVATGKTLAETESFTPRAQLPKWAQPVAGDNPD